MGRHIRKMTLAEASQTAGREMPNAVRCGSCRFFKDGYCSVFAKFVSRTQRACKYGKILLRAERQKQKWRKAK